MDMGGTPYMEGTTDGLTIGFPAAIAINEAERVENNMDLLGYDALTEAEKEELILRCKGAKTAEEMRRIAEEVAPGVDIQQVYEEEREHFI